MPQLFVEKDEILVLQRQLMELKQKLKVEESMMEASKRIQASMDRKQNAQQVQNSLKESSERIRFLADQIGEMESKLKGISVQRSDLRSAVIKAASSENLAAEIKLKPVNAMNELDFWRHGQSLSAKKVGYKIRELGCRLTIQENILAGFDRMLDAWQTHGSASGNEPTEAIKKLHENRDLAKQRIAVLSQAFKKYTTLSLMNDNLTADDLHSAGKNVQFTGKLLIKVSQLSYLNSACRTPFTLEFVIDQLSSFGRTDNSNQGVTLQMPIQNPVREDNGCYGCYQELNTKLQQASELQIILKTGPNQVINGIFFMKFASLFPCGPEQEWKLTETLELEPAGAFAIQMYYQPDKALQQRNAIAAETNSANRIQRKPALKRTQHHILGHQLVSTNFFQLLKCSYCQDLIINSSGFQCSRKTELLQSFFIFFSL